jgi:hypothetical protein
MTDLSDLIGLWPEGCADQETYLNQMISILNTKWIEVQNGSSRVLTISQATEPTQAQWESQWVIQTGYALPIPSSAVLVWYNNYTAKIGGIYGTAAGFSTVFRREHQSPIGSTIYFNRASLISAQSITTNLVATAAIMPSLTFTITQKAHFLLEFILGVGTTVACGADFLVNGVKIGTTNGGAAPDNGIVQCSVNSILRASYSMLNMLPGTYTIQALCGLNGSTTGTITVGGATALGARSLIVRAIAAP